ncbi:MAG: U32 family peptidase [Porphyromonadaceae bacterium]|nr:U32 family peptidase [Porphyromonadaceae bacterium]
MPIKSPRPIELLAPAKDLEAARAAIQHGADAIYIGAPKFGARSAAGVPLEDLRILTQEAHLYGVRIYVALNTILYDHELSEVETLIWDIWRAGADALIVQDMGVTKMNLPPIPLHASTQCDTTETEDALQLESLGFDQIVLARELNTKQIKRIYAVVNRPLEVFVHGALCVSYSGRCYLSEEETKRSANRGACSQQCRLPYDLVDSQGRVIRSQEHLLSPMDLNRADMLEELLEAGASSLKIEGRLKGISYVKNITAYYRQKLDRIIDQHPKVYRRASLGRHTYEFTPNPYKSFNRGFTQYQFHLATLQRHNKTVINPHSPKSQGEYLGTLTHGSRGTYQLSGDTELNNGDGLLYITPSGQVGGIKVNRALPGSAFQPARPVDIPRGSRVFRNQDQSFERLLSNPSASRRLAIGIRLSQISWGLRLEMWPRDLPRLIVSKTIEMDIEPAKKFDEERLRSELAKLGDSIFVAEEIAVDLPEQPPFVPLSILSELRRTTTQALMRGIALHQRPDRSIRTLEMRHLDRSTLPPRPRLLADYKANISNRLAREHYRELGYAQQQAAYELTPTSGAELMCTKHCIRHYLGYCTRETKKPLPYSEPLYLCQRGQRLRLRFDCSKCQMLIYKD